MSDRLSRGYVTIAIGHERYHAMARWLMLALRRWVPDAGRALVTDSVDERLLSLADVVIPPRSGLSSPYEHKFLLQGYSPFNQTVFLDADCLVVRDPGNVWEKFGHNGVGVFGTNRSAGTWWVHADVICKLTHAETAPILNGGFIRFDAGEQCREIFASARHWYGRLGDIDTSVAFRGTWNDEPALSLALAERGIRAYDDVDDGTYRTALAGRATAGVDILGGRAWVDGWGVISEPAIVHFAGSAEDPVYRQAGRALTLSERGVPDGVATWLSRRLTRRPARGSAP